MSLTIELALKCWNLAASAPASFAAVIRSNA